MCLRRSLILRQASLIPKFFYALLSPGYSAVSWREVNSDILLLSLRALLYNSYMKTNKSPYISEKDTNSLLASLGGLEELEAQPQPQPQLPKIEATVPTLPSSSGQSGLTSATEQKALQLLGAGVSAEQTASALGVTPSRIAQLLSTDHFKDKVAELRYENLQKHNRRDNRYDSLEDRLLDKLDKALPLLIKPESILKAVTIVNGAKRRGQSAPQQVTNQQNIVTLVLPTVIIEKFSIDINNQVTKAGSQELLTMASGNLLKRVEEAEEARLLEHAGESNVSEERR